ncbi:MAG: M20/M25/M40 family metallo-hydrolase [Clostridia bacterium]|nr:M20/M25/M40 family metallo-hydrolase [Clostridia bacterium]
MKNSDLFINELDYADLNAEGAVEHLRGALRFATTSYVDTSRIRYEAFESFQAYLRETYPKVFSAAEVKRIGYSLLLRLPGQNAQLKPALFMAHQDVVPVVPGTEGNWTHGPFSGDLADGMIWGRGAMDIKEMLVGILESAEYLLGHHKSFERTVYLFFGEDEETCSTGVRAAAGYLKEHGIELEFVLDEGAGDVMDAADYGARGELVCPIGVFEKGYVDMKLSVKAQGGHSSNPFHGTSLGTLSRGITAIIDHLPEAHLSDSVFTALERLKPHMTDMHMLDMVNRRDEPALIEWFLAHESLYHLVQTTAAPTMIQGGSAAGNVMPQDMEAVINFRLTNYDTPESLLAHCRQLAGSEVQCSLVQQICASRPSDTDAYGYRQLVPVLEHYFDRLIFIPAQNRGATDARHFECVCRCVLRFGPFLEEEEVSREGIHGTNERISVRAYLQGIRVLTRFMEKTCVTAEKIEDRMENQE